MTAHPTHLIDRPHARATVCGVGRALGITTSVDALLSCVRPCPQCLEWVVEHGQMANRRLQSLSEQREPHQ
jgi:hypothetical protein